jgi:hypothetical protein
MISKEQSIRLNSVIEMAWEILFEQIISGRLLINKEASLQLHLSKLIFDLGTIYCILPKEHFEIEMETNYNNKSIDIVCTLGKLKAAIEIKCFMKASNRATDNDCYDSLLDIEKLQSYNGFQIRKFICLTNNKYYAEFNQTGLAKTVTLQNGRIYPPSIEVIVGWVTKRKDTKRDKPIIFNSEVRCDWVSKEGWHYLKIDIEK